MKPLYPCDPMKNVNCKKEMCFMWGGECSHTTDPKYARTLPQGEKRLSFRSWEELLKAAHSYVVMGYEVEVKGWNDISNNVLTIRDRWKKELEQKPGWIPVSEKLPEDGKMAIFTDGISMSIERYKMDALDHFYPEGRYFNLEDAVAWMPLPEPYKAETENT